MGSESEVTTLRIIYYLSVFSFSLDVNSYFNFNPSVHLKLTF